MELDRYKDVHPNWDTITALSKPQARATLKLLLAGAFLDGKLTSGELQALAESWQHLPFVGPQFSGSTLEQLLAQTYDELEELVENPGKFEAFVKSQTDKFDEQETELAVFRLLGFVLTEDGFDEIEQSLMHAVAWHFDFDAETTEDVVRSVWESYQESLVSSPGKKRKKSLVEGKHWTDMRKKRSYPTPFDQRVV